MKLSEIYQYSLTGRAMDSVGRIYSDSLPACFFRSWSEIYKNSRLHSILNTNTNKAQTYKDSFSYRALNHIISGISSLCHTIHDYISEYFKFSVTGHAADTFSDIFSKGSKNLAAVPFFAALGFALAKTVMQRWNIYSVVLLLALILLSFAALMPASQWKDGYKQSLFSKLINIFFEK